MSGEINEYRLIDESMNCDCIDTIEYSMNGHRYVYEKFLWNQKIKKHSGIFHGQMCSIR